MAEDANVASRAQSSEYFALQAAASAGRLPADSAPVYPKIVAPVSASKASPTGFDSYALADAVNKLVGSRPFNVPAAGIVGILGSRTVANQGFAA